MRCLYIPSASFIDEKEIDCINKKLSLLSYILFEEVNDDVVVWIVGNREKKFFSSLMQDALDNDMIFDPSNELPVNRNRELTHIAVVNYKYSNVGDVTRETIYGNTDYHIYDFVNILLHRLKLRFPKSKSHKMQEHRYGYHNPHVAA